MSKIYKVINKNSNVLIEGQPKLPTAEQLEPGEIAVNYAASGETLSIKNSNNRIVTFSCDDKFNESFRVMSKAMCDLDDRVLALEAISAITVGDLIETDAELENVTTSGKVVDALLIKDINNDIDGIESSAITFNTRITNLETSATSIDTRVTNLETSAGTLDTRLSNLEASAVTIDDIINTEEAFSALTASGKVVDAKLIKDIIYDNEETTASALNNLNDKIIELSGATPDINMVSTVESLSALTESGYVVDAKLIRDIVYDNEETTASALNNLNDKIIELSGTTPSLETTLAVSGDSAITVTVGEETSNALVVPYSISASTSVSALTITNTVTTEAELSALTQSGSYVDAKLIRDIIYDNEEVTSLAINDLNEDKEDKSNKVSAVTSGSTDEQYPTAKCVYGLQKKIEDNDIAIAGVLNDLNDRIDSLEDEIGDIESLLAQI